MSNNKDKRTASYYPGHRWRKLYPTNQPTIIEKLSEALSRIDPSDQSTRNIVGKALYHAGLGFNVWEDWSRNSPHYNPLELKPLWERFGTAETTYTGGLDVVLELARRSSRGR